MERMPTNTLPFEQRREPQTRRHLVFANYVVAAFGLSDYEFSGLCCC
jgi:hypothetical protein